MMWLRFAAKFLKELLYLRDFSHEIWNGEVNTQAEVERRMDLYANSVYNTFWQGKAQQLEERAQATARTHRYEEYNQLDPRAQHCQDCVDQEGLGWVALGTLTTPGTRECQTRDRCRIRYRSVNLQTGEIVMLG